MVASEPMGDITRELKWDTKRICELTPRVWNGLKKNFHPDRI